MAILRIMVSWLDAVAYTQPMSAFRNLLVGVSIRAFLASVREMNRKIKVAAVGVVEIWKCIGVEAKAKGYLP